MTVSLTDAKSCLQDLEIGVKNLYMVCTRVRDIFVFLKEESNWNKL